MPNEQPCLNTYHVIVQLANEGINTKLKLFKYISCYCSTM